MTVQIKHKSFVGTKCVGTVQVTGAAIRGGKDLVMCQERIARLEKCSVDRQLLVNVYKCKELLECQLKIPIHNVRERAGDDCSR